MSYAESIQPSIEAQDTHSIRIGDVLDKMWPEIFDTDSGKLRPDTEAIVAAHNQELIPLIGERFRVRADDVVFVSPQTDMSQSNSESTIFPSRPMQVSGEFLGLSSVDAESLPNWASVYGRPMGTIPGVRILNTPDSKDAVEYEYFVPIFSISSIANA